MPLGANITVMSTLANLLVVLGICVVILCLLGKKKKWIVCCKLFLSTTLMVVSIVGSTLRLLIAMNFVA